MNPYIYIQWALKYLYNIYIYRDPFKALYIYIYMGTRSLSTSSGGDSTSSSPIVGIIRHSIYMCRRSTNTYIYI